MRRMVCASGARTVSESEKREMLADRFDTIFHLPSEPAGAVTFAFVTEAFVETT